MFELNSKVNNNKDGRKIQNDFEFEISIGLKSLMSLTSKIL